jgi:hypothetical protein
MVRKNWHWLACAIVLTAACDSEPTAPVDAVSADATSPAFSVSNPQFNFCPNDVSTKSEITTDAVAGVTYTSTVFVPATEGTWLPVGIYFNNDGPGDINFPAPSWSMQKGEAIPFVTPTIVPMTPSGSIRFHDGGWSGGPYPVNLDFLGCVFLRAGDGLTSGRTAHLNFSFTRDGQPHTMRVNVQVR